MRSRLAEEIAPFIGSLGLHVALVSMLILVARHPTRSREPSAERPDAWLGNAVEVDAVASPETAPSSPSTASDTSSAAHAEAESSRAAAPPKAADASITEPPTLPAPPKPRPTHATKPPPSAASERETAAAPSTSSDHSQGASTTAPASGAFGGEGLPPGVRSLPSAFTRAIPPATGADPVWQTLPLGSEHPFTIAIEIDAEGHVSSAEILKEKDGSEPAIQASHLKQRVVALLGGGLFALQDNVGEGRALFRITITLSDRAVHEDDDPAQLVERGFEPPHGAGPGRAYFTLASGRHFEAKVQVLPTK